MRLTQPKMSKMSKSVVDRAAQYRHLRTLYNSSADDQTEMLASNLCSSLMAFGRIAVEVPGSRGREQASSEGLWVPY